MEKLKILPNKAKYNKKNKKKIRSNYNFKRNDIVQKGDKKARVLALQEDNLVVKINNNLIEEWHQAECVFVEKAYIKHKRL